MTVVAATASRILSPFELVKQIVPLAVVLDLVINSLVV
jgi:hypothetical protein